jgi:hypothetical protein
LRKHGRYVDPKSTFSRYRGVVRPPGYPVFHWALCKAGIPLNEDMRWIIWPHVALSLAMPLATMWIAYSFIRRLWFATSAGLLSAVSPTGIAIPAIPVADMLFAVVFATAFAVSLRTYRRRGDIVCALAAGVLFAVALSIKPSAMLWPGVCAILLFVRYRWSRAALIKFVALALPMIGFFLAWSYRNYRAEGVFTYSAISQRNMLYFVVPKVANLHETGRIAKRDEFKERFAALSLKQEDYIFRTPGSNVKGLLDWQKQTIRETIWSDVPALANTLARNTINQLAHRWKQSHRQIPGQDWLSRQIRTTFDRTQSPLVILAENGGIMLAVILGTFMLRGWKLFLVWYLFATWLQFVLPMSTVSDEGTRLLYPAEPQRIVLCLVGVWLITRLVSRRLTTWRNGRLGRTVEDSVTIST